MFPHLVQGIPLVAIHNNLETFYGFLSRSSNRSLIEKRKYRGDRSLFWLGDPKMVVVTAPIPNAEFICQRWGYAETEVVSPESATHQLSLDALNDPVVLERIVSYAGPTRTLQLVPYATTPEFYVLVNALRKVGLTVHLPESPAPNLIWLRNYIDSKAGFRTLASRWVSNASLLPKGMICKDVEQAADVAAWFDEKGQICVVKSNDGESGIGHTVLSPTGKSKETLFKELQQNPFLGCGEIIVEQYIASSQQLSPSLEFFIPPPEKGQPEITYLSQQIFEAFGRFAGVLVSREFLDTAWYPILAECGLKIADQLQQMGYVGHFDLDTVVDDQGQVYLLEVNARRTGGTYVHEFARYSIGSDYLDQVVLLSNNKVSSGGIRDIESLMHALDGLLFPNAAGDTGVVITVTSDLASGEFGCIFLAPSTQEALKLKKEVQQRLSLLVHES